MKTLLYSGTVVLLMTLTSCTRTNNSEPEYTTYKPLLIDRTDLENSVSVKAAQPLKATGKIYTLGSYLFINELHEGVHIYDNSDPANPVNLAFVKIPGSVDMAVKGNIMYVDNAVDLVVLDITDPYNIKQVNRVKNVFPEPLPPDGKPLPPEYTDEKRPENTVIIAWK